MLVIFFGATGSVLKARLSHPHVEEMPAIIRRSLPVTIIYSVNQNF
ncbi:MAG TPA: hypothetical protein VMU29_06780 [Smithella sp.]|nr:hypothetical protein [Smithella sp.]